MSPHHTTIIRKKAPDTNSTPTTTTATTAAADGNAKKQTSVPKDHDHLSANAIVRHTVLSAGSVLAAFTLRDFMQSLLSRVVSNQTSIVINFFYTLLIFIVIIWIAYIWQA